jgi:hypothetical protein
MKRLRLNTRKRKIFLSALIAILFIVTITGCTSTAPVNKQENTDAYFNAAAADPAETVRDFLEAMKEQDYTNSLYIYEIAVSDNDTARIIERFKGSDYAKSENWTDEYIENNITAVAAYYSVRYDHGKIFYDDGEIIRRFYLQLDDETGLWRIWDNDGGIELAAFASGNNEWPECLTKPLALLDQNDGLTLLERTYEDTDSDGDKESIELYTSAQIAPDGQMGWDTGHKWVLLVRKGKEVFTLFDEYVQYGELQFWIASFNKNNIGSPASVNLQRQIYATVTTNVGFKLLNYYWDAQNHCYQEEIVLDPPDQWAMRHSNKYNIPDPAKIE